MLIKFRKLVILITDAALINLSLFLAILLFFSWNPPVDIKSKYILLILLVTFTRLLVFWMFGLYEWSFRHISIREAISVFKAITISTILLILATFLLKQSPELRLSVLIMDYFICLSFIFAFRFFPRLIVNFKHSRYENPKRLLIVAQVRQESYWRGI